MARVILMSPGPAALCRHRPLPAGAPVFAPGEPWSPGLDAATPGNC